MDAAERELFEEALVGALAGAADVDAVLADLGWDEALADDPRAAVSVLFEWQGRTATSSSALHRVMGAEVLPVLGTTERPTVRGLALRVPAGLDARRVVGLDPALGLFEVTGTPHAFWPEIVDPGVDGSGPETVKWGVAVAAGQRAIAHELIGASAAMLDLAREHALERIQFGVPIASFQAVRHRLADSLVAVESARGALDAAWRAGTPFDAAVAKAIAGRGARLVARHAQQVLAGIGFTMEHPLHRYVRRVRVLDGLLGDARSLTRELGDQLLRERGLPAIPPL